MAWLDSTKNKQHQRGFGLVQSILVGLVLVIFMLGAATLLTTISESSTNAQAVLEFENALSQLNNYFSNETSCRLAIGGPTVLGGAPDAAVQTLLANGPTAVRFYVPGVAGGGAGGRLVFADVADSSANRFGPWRLEVVQIIPISPPPPVPGGTNKVMVNVRVEMSRIRRAGIPNDLIRRASTTTNLTVYLDPSNNNIISCSPISFATGQNSFSVPVCPPYHALFSDGTHLGCRMVRCPPPRVPVGGWDAEGHILCTP